MKSEAAIYLPPEKLENPKPDYNRVASTKNTLTGSLVNAHLKNINIDTYTFSKNLTLQGKTEFAQRYAVGALTKIINKQPVTNKTMLDSLFNTYAPSLNASLEQTGYNSLMQMKDAVANGTVNPSTFLTGFSNALNAIQEEKDFLYRRKKYGKEIPIDLVTKCDYTYDLQIAKHPTPLGKDAINYIKDFGTVNIIVSAHVKNETAEIWQMSDYSNKLTDAMLQKQFVVFRIGNTIYEDIIISKYKPIITNIYDLSFDLTLQYNYLFARESKFNWKKGIRVVNSDIDNQRLRNLLAKPEYIGEGKVEKVKPTDTLIIQQAKKALGKDKIIINGQEL